MLYIEPIGGLCNRMRAVNSAYYLAEKMKVQLTIVWVENSDLNCKIESLFTLPKTITVVDVRKGIINGLWRKIKFRTVKQHYDESAVLMIRDENYQIDIEQFDTKKDIYFKTGQQFYRFHNYDLFVPTNMILKRVEMITKDYNSRTIGIHIRRTDNIQAKQMSSIESFICIIKKELNINPETCFYLSTDDFVVENDIRQHFGGAILTQKEKNLNRDSEKGIRDALVDLLCLSRTSHIYGSYWSSFSDVSAMIGNIELTVVSK